MYRQGGAAWAHMRHVASLHASHLRVHSSARLVKSLNSLAHFLGKRHTRTNAPEVESTVESRAKLAERSEAESSRVKRSEVDESTCDERYSTRLSANACMASGCGPHLCGRAPTCRLPGRSRAERSAVESSEATPACVTTARQQACRRSQWRPSLSEAIPVLGAPSCAACRPSRSWSS